MLYDIVWSLKVALLCAVVLSGFVKLLIFPVLVKIGGDTGLGFKEAFIGTFICVFLGEMYLALTA
jgi:hypothetical protein